MTPPDWFVFLMGIGMLGGLVYTLQLIGEAVAFIVRRLVRLARRLRREERYTRFGPAS